MSFETYTTTAIDLLACEVRILAQLALKNHYYCEDSWYSCPQDQYGTCNDAAGTDCNCGATKHNEEVYDRLRKITTILEGAVWKLERQ